MSCGELLKKADASGRRREPGSGEGGSPLSLPKTVAILARMKDLLDRGRFDKALYERMALDVIRDYLSTLDDSARLIFVSYEIQDSELFPFLTGGMVAALQGTTADRIAGKKGP